MPTDHRAMKDHTIAMNLIIKQQNKTSETNYLYFLQKLC